MAEYTTNMSKVDELLAHRISTARVEINLTEQQLADQLDISVEEYVLIEAGKARVGAKLLSQIALVLDRPIAWFFDQQENKVSIPITQGRELEGS